MLNIKILLVPDLEKLTRLIAQSKGKVFLLQQNRTLYDLTEENANMDLLKEEVRNRREIDIYLAEKEDYFRFIYYFLAAKQRED